jgi:DNA-binding MarR family transcriptional regulator
MMAMTHSYIEEFTTLAGAQRAIKFPMQYIPVLGYIAIMPGINPTHLSTVMGIEMDQISRILKVLRTEHHAVDFEHDPQDRRTKRFYLTDRGKSLVLKWLTERNIAMNMDEVQRIPIILPQRAKSRVRGLTA